MSDYTFRGQSRGGWNHCDAVIEAANRLNVRVAGVSSTTTERRFPWLWRRPIVQEFRFTARCEDADALADFVHEVGAQSTDCPLCTPRAVLRALARSAG